MTKNVLVIDDDEMILKTLKRLLTKEGYKITIAPNGAKAFNEITQHDFDLIISDIKMPEMDGVEVLKKIREHLASNNLKLIPEIIITGYAKEKIYQDALALKAAAYIDKPFDMKPLLEAIVNLIGTCR